MKVVVRGLPYTESTALKYQALTEGFEIDLENSVSRQSTIKKSARINAS